MRIQNLAVESIFFLSLLFTTATTFTVSSNGRYPKTPTPFNQFLVSPTRSSEVILAASEADTEEEPKFLEIASLTDSQVTELIELSFFQACFALSKGETDPLKLFIFAVKIASQKYPGVSAISIAKVVDSVTASVRPLEPAERDVRETWIRAIYLMMGHVLDDFDAGSCSDDDQVAKTYGPVLADLVAIHQSGLGLNVNRFVGTRRDMLLVPSDQKNILALEDAPDDVDLMKLSVVTQTIRVLYTTLDVLSEDDDDEETELEEEPQSKSASPIDKKEKNSKKKTKTDGKGFA